MNPELVEVLSNRGNHGIDPHLHIWGWEVPGYLFLGGIVAGIMVLLAALELVRGKRPTSLGAQLMPFVAVALISIGMGFLFLDLANKERVYAFYLSFQPTSAMSWGSWILMLVYPVLIVLGLGGLDEQRRDLVRNFGPLKSLRGLVDKAFAFADAGRTEAVWLSLLLGVGLGAYTGLLLGTMAARPLWNSTVLGPLFLTSGISTGAALMLLSKPADDEAHLLVKWDIAAIAVELSLLAVLVIGLSAGVAPVEAAGHLLLGGPFTASFWGLVVVAGLLVPLGLNLLEVTKHLKMTLVAPALVLMGGLALRTILVAAGQVSGFGHLG